MKLIKKFKKNEIFKNILVILSGDCISTLITLVCLSILINKIGLEQNGIIIMVQTYCLLFNDIFNFQSFNAIIKYLPKAIDDKNVKAIKHYIFQAITLDFSTAILASFFGFICLPYVASFMNWDNSIMNYIRLYLVTILINIQGTPIGILRIYGKFNYVSYANVFTNIIKLGLYLVCVFSNGNIVSFLLVEIFTEVLRNLIMLALAYKTMVENKIHDFYKEKFKFDKEFFAFNFYNNIVVTLDLPISHITTFFINKYLGFADNSIYRVFQRIGGILQKVAVPVNQVIYPEFCKMISKNKYKEAIVMARKMFLYIFTGGTLAVILVAITNKLWLWVLIPQPKGYVSVLILYLIVQVIINSCLGLHPLFVSLGLIKYNIPIISVSNVLYIGYFFLLIKQFGLAGVILATGLQALMVVLWKVIIIKKKIIYKNNEMWGNLA